MIRIAPNIVDKTPTAKTITSILVIDPKAPMKNTQVTILIDIQMMNLLLLQDHAAPMANGGDLPAGTNLRPHPSKSSEND